MKYNMLFFQDFEPRTTLIAFYYIREWHLFIVFFVEGTKAP